jgi:hypothetical protein
MREYSFLIYQVFAKIPAGWLIIPPILFFTAQPSENWVLLG